MGRRRSHRLRPVSRSNRLVERNQGRQLMSHSSWVGNATDSLILRAFVIKAVRRALLASAITASFAFASHDASAQQQQAADTETQVLQEVVVTGSLIRRPNAETAEAITVLKADALRDQGITNVEQVLNTLTSASPTVNVAANVGTFTGGGTYANLRHLGNGNTLVLLDGQRLAPNAFNGLGSTSVVCRFRPSRTFRCCA